MLGDGVQLAVISVDALTPKLRTSVPVGSYIRRQPLPPPATPFEASPTSEPVGTELKFTQKSIVKIPARKSKSEDEPTDSQSPVPSNKAEAPPNLDCAVSTWAFPTAVTVFV